MKKIVLLFIIIIFLTGCGIVNLDYFVIPDDIEFIYCINKLDTPEKICNYMKDNFIVISYHKKAFSPYEMWLNKNGDCNDYSTFAIFCANYHNYEVYQMCINLIVTSHMVGIYRVENGYLVSSWDYLYPQIYKNFQEIINIFAFQNWREYTVYNYDMNIVGQGYNK